MGDLPTIPLEWLPEEVRHDVKFIGYLHPSRADVVDSDDPTATRRLIEAMAIRLGLDVSMGAHAEVFPHGSGGWYIQIISVGKAYITPGWVWIRNGSCDERRDAGASALADLPPVTSDHVIVWHTAHWVLDPKNAAALGVDRG